MWGGERKNLAMGIIIDEGREYVLSCTDPTMNKCNSFETNQ